MLALATLYETNGQNEKAAAQEQAPVTCYIGQELTSISMRYLLPSQ